MRIMFLLIVAVLLVATPSHAQNKKKPKATTTTVGDDSTSTVIGAPRKKVLKEKPVTDKSRRDSTFQLQYSDRSIIRDSAGRQHATYEGKVVATIMQYQIMAERVDYYSEPEMVVAIGNVTVIHHGKPIPAQRFHWRRSEPESPVIEPR